MLLLLRLVRIMVSKTLVNPSTRRSVGRLSLPRKSCSSGCVLLSSSACAWVALASSCWMRWAAACCSITWLSTYCCMACLCSSVISRKGLRSILTTLGFLEARYLAASFFRYGRKPKTSHTAVCRQPSVRAASSCQERPTRKSQRNPSGSRRREENATRGTSFPRQRQPTHRSPCGGIDESFRHQDAAEAGEKQPHSLACATPATSYGYSPVRPSCRCRRRPPRGVQRAQWTPPRRQRRPGST